MKLVQVKDNQIVQYDLSKTGTLKDGSTVSAYHLLDEEVLLDEGWLPLEDNPPEHDEETQYLVQDGYEILEDKVIKKYKVELIPEQEEYIDEMELMKEQIVMQDMVIQELMFEILPMLGGM